MRILYWLLYALSIFVEVFEIIVGSILDVLEWIQGEIFKALGRTLRKIESKNE